MNKYKEWLEKAAQDKIDNYEDAWDVVAILNKFNELTKDKTFIEVPKEVKLSIVVRRLEMTLRGICTNYIVFNNCISFYGFNNVPLFDIHYNYYNNKINTILKLDNYLNLNKHIDINDNDFKWLYQYWIAETKIINDLEEEDE